VLTDVLISRVTWVILPQTLKMRFHSREKDRSMSVNKTMIGLLVAVLLVSGCATPVSPITPTTAEIRLVPFTDQHFGVQTVRPEGWAEIQPGTFVEEAVPPYVPQFLYGAYPGFSSEWADLYFARELGVEELPERADRYDTAYLHWELTQFEVDHPEMGEIVVDGALAENETDLFIVAVLADREKSEPLHEGLLLPALDALSPLEVQQRDHLTKPDLLAGEVSPDSPVNNVYLTPIGEVGPPQHQIEGTLFVPQFRMSVSESDVGDQAFFPGFSTEFFTHDEYLVPVQRDILPANGNSRYWNTILSPGKAWSEPADGGLSRASLPFLLVAPQSNEAHNGVATFLYDQETVSSLYLQVTQETAAWNRTDFWGQSTMQYVPDPIDDVDELEAAFTEELKRQTSIRPWSDLADDYDPNQLATFNDRFHPWDISASGLVLDGTIYLQPCLTRYGEYPYCRYMRHGVFSVTKSMGAAVAMLRLAEKYGERVFDLKVSDYVEVTTEHDGWKEVTFGDALNMATGIGDDPNLEGIMAEEDQPRFSRFLEARSAEEKLDVCFSYGSYPWGPGEAARYNSINTFVLSVAMTDFLKAQEGPDVDIWDMVLEEVYRPIGIQHAPIMRTHEPDGSKGIPIFGYGLYPTIDDVAKVATLFHNGGKHDGEQLLHPGKLAEAFYQTDVTGLPTGDRNQYGEATYHMSFWSLPYRTDRGALVLVPYMSGYGGNHVALMPNGMTAFRFADAHIYGVDEMVRVADSVHPF
jgi:CubicO group peptidase (beta-lactamase class C family)